MATSTFNLGNGSSVTYTAVDISPGKGFINLSVPDALTGGPIEYSGRSTASITEQVAVTIEYYRQIAANNPDPAMQAKANQSASALQAALVSMQTDSAFQNALSTDANGSPSLTTNNAADPDPAAPETNETPEPQKTVDEPNDVPKSNFPTSNVLSSSLEVDEPLVIPEDSRPEQFLSEPPTVDDEPLVLTGDNVPDQFTPPEATQESVLRGLTGPVATTQATATAQDIANFKQKEDWRVRLSLAPESKYLYNDPDFYGNGILAPLNATDGVIFPYTPSISVQYAAHYDQTEITHSNYKFYQYKSSSVDQISISCDFTAQDTAEARYLLAVIHFFRSVTKMFYGQDNGPKPGTPPPLCYLTGLGSFQFDAHPLAISSFNYTLPTDVDYIRAGSVSAGAGVNQSKSNNPINSTNMSTSRLSQANLGEGAMSSNPKWSSNAATQKPTYVPTKMQIQITAVPIVTRYDISNNFSLKKYASGQLLQGSRRSGGGIW